MDADNQRVDRGRLWIVSAPSGAGKTSLTRALIPYLAERGISASISISYTTRQPRPGEVDGVHYHFVDERCFLLMVERGEFLEHAHVFGRRYGTGRAATQRLMDEGCEVLLDIDWQGGRQVRSTAEAESVFILPPSVEELERRLRGRGQDAADVVVARMREAASELSHWSEYDHLIVNDRFEQALEELAALIRVPRLRRDAQRRRHGELIARLLDSTAPIG